MAWFDEFSIEWAEQENFRCIALEHLNPDLKAARLMSRFFLPAGITADRALAFFRHHGYITSSVDEMIQRSIEYIFHPRTRYFENRFNDSSFPALYTAYEHDTAAQEREKYVEDKDKPFEYGVFALTLSGEASDLREAVRLGRWIFPDDHGPCRLVGKEVKDSGLDGLVAASKEVAGGSNSAIFTKEAVTPGKLLKMGTFH